MTEKKQEPLAFAGVLTRISSTVDGGWRVTFELDQSQGHLMVELIKLRDQELVIGICQAMKDEARVEWG